MASVLPAALVLLGVVGAASAGCSSSDQAAAAGTDAGADAADAGSDSAVAPCSEPVASRAPGSSCVRTIAGRIVQDDPAGSPLALLTTVCGAGLCVLGRGDANGFEVALNRFVDLDASFVVHVDGRPNHANVFVRLARSPSEAIVLASPIRVPRLDQVGPAFPEAPTAASTVLAAGDVTLTLAPSTSVELDFADAALEAEGRKLRSGLASAELAGDPSIVALHALAPFGASLTPPAGVSIVLPPAAALADGTAVDIVALDDTLDGPDIGRLRVVAAATVTGGVAKSDPGTGISRLTWVGIRKKANQ